MNKKKYWLKFKENYYDEDEQVFIVSQPNGYAYSYLWNRLLLKCLKVPKMDECGFLRVNDKIPYNPELLANIFKMDVDTVSRGMELFIKMGMLEVLDDGTIYIEAVQKMIGSESESAERVRLHREKRKLLQCNESVTKRNENGIYSSTNTNNNTYDYNEIFDFWNSKENLIHHRVTDPHKSQIRISLDTYSLDEIKAAIDRYNRITALPNSLYSYQWTLKDFLKRALHKFVDDVPDENYVKKTNAAQPHETEKERKAREYIEKMNRGEI